MKNLLYILCFTILYSCSKKMETPTFTKDSYNLSTEKDLQNEEYSKAIDVFYASGNESFFKGKKEVSIYYKTFVQPNTDKAIVISSGRTEAAIKYKELIYDLYKNGFSIYILDHRGQGFSGRMTKNPEMGYVDQFQYFVEDLKTFVEQQVKPKNHQKTYLLAHSMGGAIGFSYLEQFPEDFDAAAFSSPMLGLSWYIKPLVSILISEKVQYALGQKGYHYNEIPYQESGLTGSETRYQRFIDTYEQNPKAKLGGVTYHWLKQSCNQFNYIFDHISNIKTPFILFSAENETIVNPNAHRKFIKKAKELNLQHEAYFIKNAEHELFLEKDNERNLTLNKILDYFHLNN